MPIAPADNRMTFNDRFRNSCCRCCSSYHSHHSRAPTSTLHIDLWIRQRLEISTLEYTFASAFGVAPGYASACPVHCDASMLNRDDRCLRLRHEFVAQHTIVEGSSHAIKRPSAICYHKSSYHVMGTLYLNVRCSLRPCTMKHLLIESDELCGE